MRRQVPLLARSPPIEGRGGPRPLDEAPTRSFKAKHAGDELAAQPGFTRGRARGFAAARLP